MTTYNQHLLRSLTALSLLTPLTSFAQQAMFENGFYVGAKIGGQEAMASWEQNSNVHVVDEFNKLSFATGNGNENGQVFHSNLMGNVSVGYAGVLEKYFLAAEFSVNLAEEQEFNWQQTEAVSVHTTIFSDPQAYDTINQNINTKIELENPDVILDLRPGLLLAKNFLFYGRVGVAYNKLSMHQDGNVAVTSGYFDKTGTFVPTGSDLIAVESSESKDVFGLRVGLGLEYKITRNLGLNMDYVFTDYGNIDTEFNSTHTVRQAEVCEGSCNLITQTAISSSADVTKNTATVGLNWYFGGSQQRPVYRGIDK